MRSERELLVVVVLLVLLLLLVLVVVVLVVVLLVLHGHVCRCRSVCREATRADRANKKPFLRAGRRCSIWRRIGIQNYQMAI